MARVKKQDTLFYDNHLANLEKIFCTCLCVMGVLWECTWGGCDL